MEKQATMDVDPVNCPMAAMCKGMMGNKKGGFGLLLMIPGIVLVALGVLVFIEPKILIWLVAATLIIMGILTMVIVNSLRKFGSQFQKVDDRLE